jgi:DNA-binding LytR/AlgR family response regulator
MLRLGSEGYDLFGCKRIRGVVLHSGLKRKFGRPRRSGFRGGFRLRILIADDEPIARAILREHVEAIPSLEVAGEASTGSEALARILELRPDVVLLDLQMPELDGLAVVRSLRTERKPLIIFVTAYDRHAAEAFDVDAVDYLLKPVRRERLERAIAKAERQLRGLPSASGPGVEAPRKIVGRRGTDLYLLDPSEIIAFQAEGELVHLITTTQRYLSDHSLKVLEEKLDAARFRRIHRRTIINTDHIRRISPMSSKRWMLKMSNGFEAIVSKRLAKSMREQARW